MTTDCKMDQRTPGESNPSEVFCVVNQRPMWLPLRAVQSFAQFLVEVAKQAGTAAVPQPTEQAHYAKHAALHGVTMGA